MKDESETRDLHSLIHPSAFIIHPCRRQLPRMDSNHDKEYQKLLCYRYTTG
jgi:hypothetical protein